jgi:hypothetical protein
MTTKKAVDYLKDKKVLDDTCAANYPVRQTEVDSAGFKESLHIIDSLFDATLTLDAEKQDLAEYIRQLQEADTTGVLLECDSLFQSLIYYGNQQKQEKEVLRKQVAQLRQHVASIKPIEIKVIDSALMNVYRDLTNQCEDANHSLKAKLDIAQDEIKEFKSNKKKPLVALSWFGLALASQWWFWIIIVGFVAYKFRSPILKLLKF